MCQNQPRDKQDISDERGTLVVIGREFDNTSLMTPRANDGGAAGRLGGESGCPQRNEALLGEDCTFPPTKAENMFEVRPERVRRFS